MNEQARQEFLSIGKQINEHISVCKICVLDNDLEFINACLIMRSLDAKAARIMMRLAA